MLHSPVRYMILGVSQTPTTLFGRLSALEQLLNEMVNFVTLSTLRAPGPLPPGVTWCGAAHWGLCSLPGGQCLLAVDVPGPPPAEEQQGPLLPAAVEASAPHPPEPGSGQGLVVLIRCRDVGATDAERSSCFFLLPLG